VVKCNPAKPDSFQYPLEGLEGNKCLGYRADSRIKYISHFLGFFQQFFKSMASIFPVRYFLLLLMAALDVSG
jgi:hypothetical protein